MVIRAGRLCACAGVALVALVIPAGGLGAPPSTATSVRIGEHPAYVRAVVAFVGALSATEVAASDAQPSDGVASLQLSHAAVSAGSIAASADGIGVRVSGAPGELTVRLSAAPGRFKYVAYAVVGSTRLAIDLYKSAPPTGAATIRAGADGHLTIDRTRVGAGTVSASGRERALFENQFQLVVRGASGAVLARRSVTGLAGRWSARIAYHAAGRQRATLEAVALSPKDGALACLAQVPITLPAR